MLFELMYGCVALTGVWVGLLSLRLKALEKLGCYWFAFVCFVALCFASVASHFGSWFLSKTMSESTSCRAANLAFRFTLLLNPHVNVRGKVDWSIVPKRAVVLMNHTSWLDSVIFVANIPNSEIVNFRTLLKANLFDLPIAGHMFQSAGHFPVYFKKDDEGSWSIDKEKQDPVQKRMNSFMQRDVARLSFYPEGAVNKDPRKLMSFRRGSFAVPVEQDLPVYAFLMVGNNKSWPTNGLPGAPADIDVKLMRVCDKVSLLPDHLHNPAALSEFSRDTMQNELNRIEELRENPSTNVAKQE